MTAPTRASTTRATTTREITARAPIVTDLEEDAFYLPPAVKAYEQANNVRYEWKRIAVRGQDDEANMDELQRSGWQPVPYDRHPELGGPLWPGRKAPKWVQRKGTHILCERPEDVCQAYEEAHRRRTADQTAAKKAELGIGTHPDIPRSGWGGALPEITETVESPTGAVLSQKRTQVQRGTQAEQAERFEQE